jgi:hypothetical protein
VANDYDDERFTERDRPLGFHWQAVDFAEALGLPRAGNAALEAARASILAEAILAAEAGKAVSYSRNRNFYSSSRRYRGTAFTYKTVLGAVADCDRQGLIIDRPVAPGNRGWQSSFVATDELIQSWRSTPQSLTYSERESVWLKNDAGEVVDYRDTQNTRAMRQQLAERREALAPLAIDVPDVEWRGQHMFINGSYVLPIPGNPVRRIFSRGSWSLHGRAYGWWQSIPKTARASMTINGEPVADVDYGSLHAAILYNQAGVPFAGDAYDVDGFERNEVKLGFNIAINAKNWPAAVAALADHLKTDRRHCAEIIGAIQRRHRPIKRHFCSDAGVRLMRIDSELILSALRAVNDNGDPALPVHDSLIVPARCANQTAAKMVESFEQIVGRVSPCRVKIKR